MKMKKTIIKTKDSSLEKRSTQQIVEEGKVFTPEEWIELQRIMKSPKIITNTLEFFTGIASAKRTDLILSVGHIIQGLFKGKLRSQLFSELGKYRKKGKISDKNLNSKRGRTILTDLLKAIDDENLGEEKLEALKSIFFKSVWNGTDEHTQMLAYLYFQVCKRLSSLDILILKTAFDIYLEPKRKDVQGSIGQWEEEIAKKLDIPQELVRESRLRNSGISQNSDTIIFDVERIGSIHGLTELGIKISEFLLEK